MMARPVQTPKGLPIPIILLTGFGPFPGAPENPSAVLVEALERACPPPGATLHAAVLPTRYDGARETVRRLRRDLRPDIAIHFGLALKARGFRIERFARNGVRRGARDAAGLTPSRGALATCGRHMRASTLPLARLRLALEERGLPVEMSADAGSYVCNAVFYASAPCRPPRMTGFVHVPLIEGMAVRPVQRARAGRGLVVLPRETLVAGALVIVDTCVAAWREGVAKDAQALTSYARASIRLTTPSTIASAARPTSAPATMSTG